MSEARRWQLGRNISADGAGSDWWFVVDQDGGTIAAEGVDAKPGDGELIAAAPALAEACRKALAILGEEVLSLGCNVTTAEVARFATVLELTNALASATGGGAEGEGAKP